MLWIDDYLFARLLLFLVVLGAAATWEELAPRQARAIGRTGRWPANLGLALIDAALVRVVVPLGALGVARLAETHGWGLLNRIDVPGWLAVLVAVVLLDAVIYGQHVLFHAVPALWQVHRVHHCDPETDATTGVRFHPIEIVLSMAIKMAAVAALGAPVAGVFLFELLLNGTSLFNHANLRLPDPVDRVLRWCIVTPDMHRIHHSTDPAEASTNFGFNLPWWDRLLGTYRDAPALGHAGMRTGVMGIDPPATGSLAGLLRLPFAGSTVGHRVTEMGKTVNHGDTETQRVR